MSNEATARLALPFLAAGQAQKEMTVNEALAGIDLTVQASAITWGVDDPPGDPAIGACWVIGDAPTGDWSEMAARLAGWTADGWRFVAPVEGMTVWLSQLREEARFQNGAWTLGEMCGERLVIGGNTVVGPQQDAIAAADGGAVIDSQARATVTQILEALRSHGLIAI